MKSLACYIILLSIVHSYAQPSDTLELWKENIPFEDRDRGIAKEEWINETENKTKLTQVTFPILQVYPPKRSKDKGVGIIVCPGGGYNILAIQHEGYEIAEWLSKIGYTAFVLQYRIPQRKEAATADLQRAIRQVKSNFDEYGLFNSSVGVIGFSAGGNLAAKVGINYREDYYPNSNDDIDNISVRPDFELLIYPAYLDEGESNTISNYLQNIDEYTPPIFVFATADDKYSNGCLVLSSYARKMKGNIELHYLPKGGHGYGLRENNIAGKIWPKLAEDWLKRTLFPESKR